MPRLVDGQRSKIRLPMMSSDAGWLSTGQVDVDRWTKLQLGPGLRRLMKSEVVSSSQLVRLACG